MEKLARISGVASSEPSSITITCRCASSSASRRSTLSPIVISSLRAATRKTHVQASSAPGDAAGAPAIARCPRTNSVTVQRHIATITTNATLSRSWAASGTPSNGITTLRARSREAARGRSRATRRRAASRSRPSCRRRRPPRRRSRRARRGGRGSSRTAQAQRRRHGRYSSAATMRSAALPSP